MSVFDQQFMRQRSCYGCDVNIDTSDYGVINSDQHVAKGEDKQRKRELDALLSEAFNTLSFEEREKQQKDWKELR